MAAIGLTTRPDLLVAIMDAGEDKGLINAHMEEAMDAAGASKAATIGTALHALTERLDLGQELGEVPAQWVPDIKAYEEATKMFKHIFIEQFAVLDKYKIAGTPDRIVEYKGELFVADLKTGRIDHPHNIAMQLAIYANALPYDTDTGHRGSWGGVNKEKAIIIHLPKETGTCKLVFVDIKEGWKGIEYAMKVRKWRDQKGLTTPLD